MKNEQNRRRTIALAGNPNTGKSTLFNALTGLRQHTGNWPGKTVLHAEGTFQHHDIEYTLVDLPGTYSLYSNSADEEVARNYIIFNKPDITMVVVDATALERNLNLVLQVLEMTEQVIVVVNLIDEAMKKGIKIHADALSKKLGVPVVKISARNKEGITKLLDVIEQMGAGQIDVHPLKITYSAKIEKQIDQLERGIEQLFGNEYPTRWVALRMLDGDEQLIQEMRKRVNQESEREGETNELSREA